MIFLDYETTSTVDLRKYGAYRYATHHSTKIICACFAEVSSGVKSWLPGQSEDFKNILRNADHIATHNAFFESLITKHILKIDVDVKRWTDTMAMCAAANLPLSLENAARTLGLKNQKDMVGNLLVKNNSKQKNLFMKDEIKQIVDYCMQDVRVMREMFFKLPKLSYFEQRVYTATLKTNLNGFPLDKNAVLGAADILKTHTKNLNKKVFELSSGKIQTGKQIKKIKDFLKDNGLEVADLKELTVSKLLNEKTLSEKNKAVLELRASAAGSSAAKYKKAIDLMQDGRIHGAFVYSKYLTGRWGAYGFQPQTLPRPGGIKTDEDRNLIAELFKNRDVAGLKMFFNDVLSALSSGVRSVIQAPKNKKLICADFSNIEIRALAWLAKEDKLLKKFAEGVDIYVDMASKIFEVDKKDVSKDMRAVGKTTVLGCGYGMGFPTFLKNCRLQNIKASGNILKKAHAIFRQDNKKIVSLWSRIERRWDDKSDLFFGSKTRFKFFKNNMILELPSGRNIFYYNFKKSGEKYTYRNGLTDIKIYGAQMTENVCQSIARDIFAHSLVLAYDKKFEIVLLVHDELVCLADIGDKDALKKILTCMTTCPNWLPEFPLAASGWEGERYRK